jgi:hypothetical protein
MRHRGEQTRCGRPPVSGGRRPRTDWGLTAYVRLQARCQAWGQAATLARPTRPLAGPHFPVLVSLPVARAAVLEGGGPPQSSPGRGPESWPGVMRHRTSSARGPKPPSTMRTSRGTRFSQTEAGRPDCSLQAGAGAGRDHLAAAQSQHVEREEAGYRIAPAPLGPTGDRPTPSLRQIAATSRYAPRGP